MSMSDIVDIRIDVVAYPCLDGGQPLSSYAEHGRAEQKILPSAAQPGWGGGEDKQTLQLVLVVRIASVAS
jgi:hypothetical protein